MSINNVCQLMYDHSRCGVKLRKYMSVSLAWWHSYKWAVKRIVRVFSSDFIAPLFHHMFPDKQFHVEKISLPTMATYCTWIRLAYKDFREDLDMAMARDNLTTRQRILLTNLSDLCNVFIPVVIVCIRTLF